MRSSNRFKLAALATSLALMPLVSAQFPQYEVHLIVADAQYYPEGINNSGYVVGRGSTRPFVYTEASGFRTIPPSGTADTYFLGVNNAATVAGASFPSQGSRGLVWTESGGYSNLVGGFGTYGAAINESGVIGGSAATGGQEEMAKWTTSTSLQKLGKMPGATYAFGWGINDLGDVVGEGDGAGHGTALIWTAEAGLASLGTLAGHDFSSAADINNHRKVVGNSGFGNSTRGFCWSPQTGMVEVGPVGGFQNSGLNAINEFDWATGTSFTGSNSHAMLWSPSLGGVDMNDLLTSSSAGWILQEGYALNLGGDVVGRGKLNGVTSVFYAKVVPEPSVLVPFFAYLVGTARRLKQKVKL